ncbi:MAG: hypothetical protein WCS88_03045 [Patescibacteria group bacterium]
MTRKKIKTGLLPDDELRELLSGNYEDEKTIPSLETVVTETTQNIDDEILNLKQLPEDIKSGLDDTEKIALDNINQGAEIAAMEAKKAIGEVAMTYGRSSKKVTDHHHYEPASGQVIDSENVDYQTPLTVPKIPNKSKIPATDRLVEDLVDGFVEQSKRKKGGYLKTKTQKNSEPVLENITPDEKTPETPEIPETPDVLKTPVVETSSENIEVEKTDQEIIQKGVDLLKDILKSAEQYKEQDPNFYKEREREINTLIKQLESDDFNEMEAVLTYFINNLDNELHYSYNPEEKASSEKEIARYREVIYPLSAILNTKRPLIETPTESEQTDQEIIQKGVNLLKDILKSKEPYKEGALDFYQAMEKQVNTQIKQLESGNFQEMEAVLTYFVNNLNGELDYSYEPDDNNDTYGKPKEKTGEEKASSEKEIARYREVIYPLSAILNTKRPTEKLLEETSETFEIPAPEETPKTEDTQKIEETPAAETKPEAIMEEEKARALIENAKSLEELIAIIDSENISIQGSEQLFTPEILKNVITKIQSGEETLDVATRSAGFRDKIAELFKIDNQAERIKSKEFNEFFANLTLEDLKDIDALKEKFNAMMTDELLQEMHISELYKQDAINKYFENFCLQSEVIMQEHIAANKDPESTLKKEGKKFAKGILGGAQYAIIMKGTMLVAKTMSSSALFIKMAVGGAAGAFSSGLNYALGKGFEKFNAKGMKNLAKKAEKLTDKGLSETDLFAQLKSDMSDLIEFDISQKEKLKIQSAKSYELSFNDEAINRTFSGENFEEKKAKLEAIQELLRITQSARENEGSLKKDKIKKRQELIKNLSENNALEEYVSYQIEKTLETLKDGEVLNEDGKKELITRAHLMVAREMNVILGDVVAQEKFDEIDDKAKSSYGMSYVSKIFGTTPPESFMQALAKGFTSGAIAGTANTDVLIGAAYMGSQRMLGSLRSEILAKSKSEVKTTREILGEFEQFELTTDTFAQAETLIHEARARIKLPDIKETERAKIELKIDALEVKMIQEAQLAGMDDAMEKDDFAQKIVGARAMQIAEAADIAEKERKRKSLIGLSKAFWNLSREEKLKVFAKAGYEGAKGALAGAIGSELVSFGSTTMNGGSYDINAGLDNVLNRVTLNAGAAAARTETIVEDIKNIVTDADENQDTATTNTSHVEIPKPVSETKEELEEKIITSDTTQNTETNQSDTTTQSPEIKNPIHETANEESKLFYKLENQKSSPPDWNNLEHIDTTQTTQPDTTNEQKTEETINPEVEKIINIFEKGVTIEDLDKVVCELDNDPKSQEAINARHALNHLLDDGTLTLEQYKQAIATHVGQELNLSNEEIAKNAIENSQIDIKTVIEVQDRLELEKEFGINSFDGDITSEELNKIAEQIHGAKAGEATALLEKLYQSGLINDEQKFSIEHASIKHTGFKEIEKDEPETKTGESIKRNLSLELAKDGAPKHLEQVFYRVGIDSMHFGDEITNVEAAQILNIGANMTKLSEGHDIAGISAEDFQKYVSVENGKVVVNDYDGFQDNIVRVLVAHAEETITTENIENSGAAYIDNIKDATWGDMLKPENIAAEQIKLDQQQIDAAENRLFQATLNNTELGELATDLAFKDEDSGTFVIDNEEILIKDNEVVRVGDTNLENPIILNNKEAGEELIDRVSEVKAEKLLSLIEDTKAEMTERLNTQLANFESQKIIENIPALATPEYDINTELETTLTKLGFVDDYGKAEWDFLKKESVSDLLDEKIEGYSEQNNQLLERHHRSHMQEFIQEAINKGDVHDKSITIEEAIKELATKNTIEKLRHDMDVAEIKVNNMEKNSSKAETVANDEEAAVVEKAMPETTINPEIENVSNIKPETAMELLKSWNPDIDTSRPDYEEIAIGLANNVLTERADLFEKYNISNEGTEQERLERITDLVKQLEAQGEEIDQLPPSTNEMSTDDQLDNIEDYALSPDEETPVAEINSITMNELYKGFYNKELVSTSEFDQMDHTELQNLKTELAKMQTILKEGPPNNSNFSLDKINKAVEENANIISKIDKQLAK